MENNLPTTEITVTRVDNKWVCRLSVNGAPWAQWWVARRLHIGLACQDLMRTFDKMGGNKHSDFARHRQIRENERQHISGETWRTGSKWEWLK